MVVVLAALLLAVLNTSYQMASVWHMVFNDVKIVNPICVDKIVLANALSKIAIVSFSQRISVNPMVAVPDVNSKDVPLLPDLLVSVLPMVVVPDVKSMGVLPLFKLVVSVVAMVLGVSSMGVRSVFVLVVYVMSIIPYAEIVVHSIGEIPFPVCQRT